MLVAEPRSGAHLFDALAQPAAGDPQGVDRRRRRLDEVAPPGRPRVETEVGGGCIEVTFERETGLRGSVTPLGSTRGLVREDPNALELVMGNSIRGGLQGAPVVQRRQPVAAESPAVEVCAKVHRGDGPVAAEPGPYP